MQSAHFYKSDGQKLSLNFWTLSFKKKDIHNYFCEEKNSKEFLSIDEVSQRK